MAKQTTPQKTVFADLLKQYLEYFLPLNVPTPGPPKPVANSLTYGKLLLQVMVDFWLPQPVHPSTVEYLDDLLLSIVQVLGRKSSLSSDYYIPSKRVVEGVLTLVEYALYGLCYDSLFTPSVAAMPQGSPSSFGSFYAAAPVVPLSVQILDTIQQPLFHFLSSAFSNWPLQSTSTTTFVMAWIMISASDIVGCAPLDEIHTPMGAGITVTKG